MKMRGWAGNIKTTVFSINKSATPLDEIRIWGFQVDVVGVSLEIIKIGRYLRGRVLGFGEVSKKFLKTESEGKGFINDFFNEKLCQSFAKIKLEKYLCSKI